MADKNIAVKHIQRNDTRANWLTHNPILLKGELGVEIDTFKIKIGNGVDNYATLPYLNTSLDRKITTQKVTALTDNQTEFDIPFEDYEEDRCYLDIRINSVWINPDKYTINGNKLVLKSGRKIGTEVFMTCHYLKNYTYTENSSLIQQRLVELEEKSVNEQMEKQKLIEEVRELKTLLMDYISNK